MSERFRQKTVVVTGAAGGIGTATAQLFAAEGAQVVICDIDVTQAELVAAAIREATGKAVACWLDVSDAASCVDVLRTAEKAFGPVAILINNAGVALRDHVDDPNPIATLRRTFDVNVMGLANMTLAAIPNLRRTRGVVVNLASIGSWVTADTGLSYAPSKAAVKLFTQSFAQQLAPDGIRVNAVAPGPVMTPMTQRTRDDPQKSARLIGRTFLGRYADPEEIARPILFLASDEASFITGTTLPVDGGYLAS